MNYPTSPHTHVTLDGVRASSALALSLNWTVETKDDLRVRGHLTRWKPAPPGGSLKVVFPLIRQVIPVWVKAYAVRPFKDTSIPVFDVELVSDGDIVETPEPEERTPTPFEGAD